MNQKLINFSELSLEALAEAAQGAFEECESVFHAIEKNYSTLERFGRILSAAKAKVPHGEWQNWITDTFQGRLPLRTASRWMLEAKRPDLADLRRETDRQKSRARVEVIDPKETKPKQEPDPGELPPLPKTNTEYTEETRKANPAELPPTRPVSVQAELIQAIEERPDPQELLEACFRNNPVTAIIRYIINSTAPQDTEDVAKQLRKGADMLDPPKKKPATKFTPPSVDDVAAYCRERKNNIDAEVFVAHYAANGWKLSNGNKMADWKSAVITWEKRNDSGKQAGRVIAGTGRIKPGAIDESKIEYR